jgi:hypothetical protein
MKPVFFSGPSSRRAAILGCSAVLLLALGAGLSPAKTATGPFSGFDGRWAGTGKVRSQEKTERIRCKANYRVADSSGHQAKLELTCKSDTYSFDLVGNFQANGSQEISGRWTERSRNIGGTVLGQARGSRIQILVESSAFAAKLVMLTRGSRQSVRIDSHGGGQVVKASINLRRKSR